MVVVLLIEGPLPIEGPLLNDGALFRASGGVAELLVGSISKPLLVSCGGAAGGSGEALSIAPRQTSKGRHQDGCRSVSMPSRFELNRSRTLLQRRWDALLKTCSIRYWLVALLLQSGLGNGGANCGVTANMRRPVANRRRRRYFRVPLLKHLG